MELGLALFHYSTILLTVALLVGEFLVLRKGPSKEGVERIARLDIGYGIGAVLVVVSGLLRVFGGEIPAAFWGGNVLFWSKMALFGVIGALSAWPTIRYLAWAKALKADGSLPDDRSWRRLKPFVHTQLALFVVIPFLAFLMGD